VDVSLDSCVHVVLNSHHGLVGWELPFFFCRGIYSKWWLADNDAAQSTNKISGTGLAIILGNFNNGHSTAQVYCVVCHFLVWCVGSALFEDDNVAVDLRSVLCNARELSAA
jgi:hypothetical protein